MPISQKCSKLVACILELLHRRTRYEKIIEVEGLKLQICPQVFNPLTGRTSAFFIKDMKIQATNRVLKIGTGSGVIAAAVAKITDSVVATDANPYAVHCAQTTLKLNSFEDR